MYHRKEKTKLSILCFLADATCISSIVLGFDVSICSCSLSIGSSFIALDFVLGVLG